MFQIAAHEQTIPLEELYEGCRTARAMLTGENAVGRVIARPFEGTPGHYVRTPHRHDFSLHPPLPNYLRYLREAGVAVHGVGKISDIFAGQDMDSSTTTESNAQGIAVTRKLLHEVDDQSFVFVNLVETDMIWGHRNDPVGFADCLREFDEELPSLLAAMRHGDLHDPHLRPRLRSDHALDRPLAGARDAAGAGRRGAAARWAPRREHLRGRGRDGLPPPDRRDGRRAARDGRCLICERST